MKSCSDLWSTMCSVENMNARLTVMCLSERSDWKILHTGGQLRW